MEYFQCVVILQVINEALGIFFRENSLITLSKPESGDFGFSLAYQDGSRPNLVVGSPHADLVGRVYRCPIDHQVLKNPHCERLDVDVKKLAPDYDINTPEQPFCFGQAVAAFQDFIMSCAPLWTTTGVIHCYSDNRGCKKKKGSHGTCFIYNSKTNKASRFKGLLEQYKTDGYNRYVSMFGNTGFSLLADPSNDLVLIGKPATFGEIQYIQTSNPLSRSNSMFFNKDTKDTFNAYFNKMDAVYYGHAFAGGRFFSDYNGTEYAFGIQNSRVEGRVGFLQYDKEDKTLKLKNETNTVDIVPGVPGDMFGSALASADVNRDGFMDLLVGAPAFSPSDHCYESGALYIYLGGDLKMNDRKYGILATKHGARFGTAIASTDLDGDSLPEIVVSAPFEDSKKGAIYIFSGYELYHKLIRLQTELNEMKVSEFQLTQRIQVSEVHWFGYSLQLIADIDGNGCDELAVGSPGNSKVLLFSGIPAVNVTIQAKSTKQVLKRTDMEVIIKVCVNVSYPPKAKEITTSLKVICETQSNGAVIDKPEFEIDLSIRMPNYPCRDVLVKFTNEDAGLFYFSAKVKSNEDELAKEKDFSSKSVRLSPYSKLEDSFSEMRFCTDTDCTPRLQMDLYWANSLAPKDYYVNSKTSENITVRIRNDGASAYDACVRVHITGAKVLNIPCGTDDSGMYRCNLPKPLSKNKMHDINILVSIDKVSATDDTLNVEAQLFTKCNSGNVEHTKSLNVNFVFINKNVFALGASHNVTITDTQLADHKFSTIQDQLEYSIVNNGSLTWPNVTALVTIATKNMSKNYTITPVNNLVCTNESDNGQELVFKCNGNLHAFSTLKIVINCVIPKRRILKHLVNNKVEMESKIEVRMKKRGKDSKNYVYAKQKTTIIYVEEMTLGTNKPLIIFLAILGAVLILIAVGYILYKVGFFKRKEKERLDSLKASFRSNRGRRTNPEQSAEPSENLGKNDDENSDDIDIEVIDDSLLDSLMFKDDAVLIEDTKENVTKPNQIAHDNEKAFSKDCDVDTEMPSTSEMTNKCSSISATDMKNLETNTTNTTQL